ncbi:YerC/YecD family TrpR-related protein [Halanaerobium praevalens]|uniref:TrpR like protein, YerC/YecD n=1 Tax=Halanaerobium praevalens (strain ATCC 33744 / DSM 2228 / GSL) TaxID=572479 RepID=E3DPH7_HALPG|nr:YerC/YecD family TrpR-related protein [Halanaerobium praevalens]ADO77739.1 TrpR like protein, YerC/YecD [Halanaerobium praevalens DSM 2228]
MSRNIKDEFTDQLFEAILKLETKAECYDFFQDVATISEIKALGQRLEVARMLKEGYTYDHIVAETGVSTATISRVKRSLEYGEDGYNLILARLNKNSN